MGKSIPTESEYEKSKRIKGYGFQDYDYKYFEEQMQKDSRFSLDDRRKKDAGQLVQTPDGELKVRPIVIESLEDYIKEITKLDSNFFNPIFYRGHTNANYLMLPSVMRNLSYKENLLYEEFCRRFPNKIMHCENAMEKLVFMQHYKTVTRTLDLSENPLLGLFFACADDKRFRLDTTGNKYKWGEVVLIRAPENDYNKKTNYQDDIKYSHSSTVSVLSTTGFMKTDFSLRQLQIEYKNDRHLADLSDCIYIRDVLSRSVIVRTKQDNPRIQRQQGAFMVVNANKIDWINQLDDDCQKNIVNVNDFSDFMLNESNGSNEINLDYLQNGLCKKFPQFKKNGKYDIHFKKIIPYSLDNDDKRFQNDPFNLRRFLYKNSNGEQVVFLIPPTAKEHIKSQLAKLNITDAFVYPEMDSVSNELYEQFTK